MRTTPLPQFLNFLRPLKRVRQKFLAACLCVLLAEEGQTQAASGTWLGTTDGTWSGLNWSATPAPGTADTATFNGTGNGFTTIDLGGGVTINTILFDTAAAASYTVGSGGVGTQTLSLDNTAAITMNSTVVANQLFNSNIVLGTAATGTTTITNVSTTNSLSFAGSITGGTGGTAGIKTVNFSPGTGGVTVNGAINKGSATVINLGLTGAGTLTLAGSGTSAFGAISTNSGVGKLIINGQTVTASALSTIQHGGSSGGLDVQTGSASFNAGIRTANADGSLIKVSGGTFSATTVELRRTSNPASETSAVSTTSGFVMTGGTATVSSTFSIGTSNSGATTLLSGGSLSIAGDIRIGGQTTGNRISIMEVSGGSLTSTSATNGIILANNTTVANRAVLRLTGGTTTAEKISFGLSTTASGSTGRLDLNGATAALYVGSGGIVQGPASGYTSTINLTSGTLGAKANWSSSLAMNLAGSSVTIKAADVSDVARDITLSGVLSGANGFQKSGEGILTLAGTNTYTGTTTVSAGALQVGSAGTGTTGTGAVTVASGASLLGTGTVQGTSFTAASGSTIYAGDTTAESSYGTLNITPASGTGLVDFQSGSTTRLGVDLSGSADKINVNGVNGTINFTFNGNVIVGPPTLTPTVVTTYDLLDWASLAASPTFHSRFLAGSYSGYLLGNGDDNLGFDLPDISGSGFVWDISNFTNDGTISAIVVPEPSRAFLLLVGLAALLTRRRRSHS